MSGVSAWRTLGIAPTRDRVAIRRAYAQRLKTTNPEDDPEAFQALRAAYEHALAMAAYAEEEAFEDDGPEVAAEPAPDPEPAEFRADPPPAPVAVPAAGQLWVGREEVDVLEARLRDLGEALRAPRPDAAAMLAAFQAVVACPAMDAVSVRAQAEHQIGVMILQAGVRSAAVIDAAVAEFGWADDHLGGPGLGQAVLARRDDVEFLRTIRLSMSRHYPAFQALSQPPRGARLWRNQLTVGLPGQVRDLLQVIQNTHPGLLQELDGQALDWWSRALARPELGPLPLWSLIVAPVAFGALLAADDSPGRGVRFGVTYLGFALAILAVIGGLVGLRRARTAWRERLADGAPVWLKLGWAPLALAAMALGAAAPVGPAYGLTAAVLGALAAGWAAITAEPEPFGGFQLVWAWPSLSAPILRASGAAARRLMLVQGLILLVIFWVLIADEDYGGWRQAAVPMLAATVAFVRGHDALEAAWIHAVRPRVRIAALALITLLAAALPFGLWATSPAVTYAPLGGVAVTAVVLLERIVSLGDERSPWRDRLYRLGWLPMLVVAVMAEEDARHGNAYLLFLGIWMLAAAATGFITAIRREREVLAMYAAP